MTQCGLKVKTLQGQSLIFCGEAIHSPGRLARVAPLQYNYNGLPGAVNCYWSAQRLREHEADGLFPSLGEPILEQVDVALTQLQQSLKILGAGRPELTASWDEKAEDSIRQVSEHVWQSTAAGSISSFLVSRSGKVLAIDYGYNVRDFVLLFADKPERKRALLHSLKGLKKHCGIDRIDTVLVSHFHDDHVCGIPLLQRLFGTQCWVPENFADLLEFPEKHAFPCNWPEPLRVDRRLALHEKVQWEEFTFHFAPMSGHTRFAALIGFEADGKRFAHTGDQYFFQKGGGGGQPAAPFALNPISQNHVYRNGALLDSYDQSERWLLDWRPDIVVQGHQAPYFTDPDFFRCIQEWSGEYRRIHEQAMPLGEEQTHFNLDSWGGWIWPYRVHLREPSTATVQVTVRNPFPHRAKMEVRLVGPRGWTGTAVTLTAEARAEVSCPLEISPNGPCRRQPFTVELTANGQPFGQVAEALMTVGGENF
jgi:glyoxylase-like metal-dependent hydrolase (beta-lactamase superfamily II)